MELPEETIAVLWDAPDPFPSPFEASMCMLLSLPRAPLLPAPDATGVTESVGDFMVIDPAILGDADVSELLLRRSIPSRSLDLSLELDEADEAATRADPGIGIARIG